MSNPFKTITTGKIYREAEAIVEAINKSLKDLYGVDTVTGLPIFRVVWSEDQYETRHGTFDDFVPGTKIWLRTVTETRTVPKYKQWIHNKHVLERLVVVPEINQKELPATKVSYEPLMPFEDNQGNYLPPRLDVCKFTIDLVLDTQAVAKAMITGNEKIERRMPRYVDPNNSQEAYIANRKAEIDKIVEELYGDETGLLGQTLSRNQGGGSAIIAPKNYKE